MKRRVRKLFTPMLLILILSFHMVATIPAYAQSSGTVIIDGYYDDWEDKPMSLLTWNSNNGNAYHDVSMVKDDEYIYIYLGMHPSYHSAIPIHSIHLSINHSTCQLFLGYANEQNTTEWSRNVDVHKRGIYTGLHPFTYDPNTSLGDAAISVYNGNERDKLEIRINIRELEKVMGLSEGVVNHGSRIALNMPNVGGQTIELVGTSSGPIFSILVSVGVVGMVLWRKHRKRLAS